MTFQQKCDIDVSYIQKGEIISLKITRVYQDSIYICRDCKWGGPEYKLKIGGKGLTHWYACPECDSYNVEWEGDEDDSRSQAV